MLNEASKRGILEILALLDDDSLLSLTATITQGLLKGKTLSRPEAQSAIINYTTDAVSFLRRKIITRTILFTYLHKNQIVIALPATKNDIIDKIASVWNCEVIADPSYQVSADNSGTVELLAEQFAQWFYTMLNQNEPISPDHFYPDAILKVNTMKNNEVNSECVGNDNNQVAQHLFLVKSMYQLVFNPNLTSEGVQGRIDPYGLVLVLACGTLHSNNVCVGVFEQVFALARDPSAANNWKIKKSELNLKSDFGIMQLPRLCDSELATPLLSLPSTM